MKRLLGRLLSGRQDAETLRVEWVAVPLVAGVLLGSLGLGANRLAQACSCVDPNWSFTYSSELDSVERPWPKTGNLFEGSLYAYGDYGDVSIEYEVR